MMPAENEKLEKYATPDTAGKSIVLRPSETCAAKQLNVFTTTPACCIRDCNDVGSPKARKRGTSSRNLSETGESLLL
jgi:hypothetical protein